MAQARARYRDALRQRDYRLLISAFLIDSIGGWAYSVVLVVYVFDRTGSPTWISIFLAASWLPKMLLAPYAGLLADRHERSRIMLASALVALAVMSALTVLVFLDAPLVLILLLAVGLAISVTPYRPAAQALLIDAVGERDLPAANGLFLTCESLVIVIGPAIGGLLLLTGEPVTAMALNALTFLVTAFLVARIQTRSQGDALHETDESRLRQLTAGLRALRSEPVAAVLLLYCLLCTTVAGTTAVLYVALSEKFGTGTEGYSYLLVGFALGGVLSASATNRLASGRLAPAVLGGMLLLSLPYVVAIWVDDPITGTLLQVVAGAGMVVVDVLAITALQRQMPRGVMSRVFALLDTGVYAVSIAGSFGTAALLEATDLRTTLLILGLGFSALSIAGIRPLVIADRQSAAAVAALQPRIALLQELDLFAALPRPALEELSRSIEEVAAEPGEVLIREGDPADALWILRSGRVDVTSQGDAEVPQELPSMVPLSYFGEIGLLRGVPRTATVRAAEPSTLYRIPADAFLEAVQGGRASSSLLAMADTRLARTHPRLSAMAEPRDD